MKLSLPSTLSVLYTLSLLAAAWECWTIVNRQPGDTFSATIRKLGKAQTLIPFMLGMLMRHLWGSVPETRAAYEAGYQNGTFWPLIDGQDD